MFETYREILSTETLTSHSNGYYLEKWRFATWRPDRSILITHNTYQEAFNLLSLNRVWIRLYDKI